MMHVAPMMWSALVGSALAAEPAGPSFKARAPTHPAPTGQTAELAAFALVIGLPAPLTGPLPVTGVTPVGATPDSCASGNGSTETRGPMRPEPARVDRELSQVYVNQGKVRPAAEAFARLAESGRVDQGFTTCLLDSGLLLRAAERLELYRSIFEFAPAAMGPTTELRSLFAPFVARAGAEVHYGAAAGLTPIEQERVCWAYGIGREQAADRVAEALEALSGRAGCGVAPAVPVEGC